MTAGANGAPTEKREFLTDEEQNKALHDAKIVVKQQGLAMQRCLDQNNLMEALKHASNFISELRTSLLSPKNYYVLYIEAFDQLRNLESYLLEEKHGKKMAELYELVQYAGNILPRLYLLVTVGSAYIKLKEAPARDVLRDLVEMCRGIQHPTRGLFLRTYLSEVTKDKLPDIGSEYEGRGGNTKDSVEFILVNFTEMNKLWVRMQHQGSARERERRELERSELRLLVGKNIARLSQLEGVDLATYQKLVLPKLLEQINSCKDVIAQQYLMEVIIQVFPDDFHLHTLDAILQSCATLQPGVNIKSILVGLMDRLSNYVARGENISPELRVFETFSSKIGLIVEQQKGIPTEDVLAIEASLLNLSISCYPDKLDYVDTIFKFASDVLAARKEDGSKPLVVKQILHLLNTPLDTFKNILTVLRLQNYHLVIQYLNYDSRKRVALNITRTAIQHTPSIGEAEGVNKLLEWISPLIQSESPQQEIIDDDDFAEEQNLVASLVHLFENKDPEQLFAMYTVARTHLSKGGPKRIKYLLVPLIFRALRLAIRLKRTEEEDEGWLQKAQKVFVFAHEVTTALSKTELHEVSVRLFLQCAQAANTCGDSFETIAYEFVKEALVIYEDHISGSAAQLNAIVLIIGTLQSLSIFSEDNYETLTTKTALYASKLLKVPDRCRAIYLVTHLFWTPNSEQKKDDKRVLEAIRKAIKVADTYLDSAVKNDLFVEILNECLYYFENACESITANYVSGLIALIDAKSQEMDTSEEAFRSKQGYVNTLNFIRSKKESDPRYGEIEIKSS
ncbi:vacuolar protein sorting protein [Planoprotostelium fungivorum]|uniref:Vacuolar protein sorting-associated protein 35 n=1 Tax=Planoprotostelium fungivorum TaxID=1890364 RepID=A0A2P6N8H0_9EUKA|nr:vacuolar protein sorting protein [Planoprotostelium fungivorum]